MVQSRNLFFFWGGGGGGGGGGGEAGAPGGEASPPPPTSPTGYNPVCIVLFLDVEKCPVSYEKSSQHRGVKSLLPLYTCDT